MLGLIRGTRTKSGLRVTARLDRRRYEKKIEVPDREMKQLNLMELIHKNLLSMCPNTCYPCVRSKQPG